MAAGIDLAAAYFALMVFATLSCRAILVQATFIFALASGTDATKALCALERRLTFAAAAGLTTGGFALVILAPLPGRAIEVKATLIFATATGALALETVGALEGRTARAALSARCRRGRSGGEYRTGRPQKKTRQR